MNNTNNSESSGNSENRQAVVERRLTAFNYADDHDNRIHADDVAQQYGFQGGLVTGVGHYAYLSRAAQRALGDGWLDNGWMEAKFIRPVYYGDEVTARAALSEDAAQDGTWDLELLNHCADGSDAAGDAHSKPLVCAIGSAGTLPSLPSPSSPSSPSSLPAMSADRSEDSPDRPGSAGWESFDQEALRLADLPEPDNRRPARIQFLSDGMVLGSLFFDGARTHQAFLDAPGQFVEEPTQEENSDLHRLHPAFVPEIGNEVLMQNLHLGPWIHTASRVQHLGPLRPKQALWALSRVARTWEKSGREFVQLQVGIFASQRAGRDQSPDSSACLARLIHTAIIRLPEPPQ